MKTSTAYKPFSYEAIRSLAIGYGATRFACRESKHSFTGTVVECYFDHGRMAVYFSRELEIQIGHFVTIRVVSPKECYVSVPYEEQPF